MASQAPLRILCLDGGGVKGLSSLHIVKELMDQTRREEDLDGPPEGAKSLRPCECFDVICGTGTGGLIAIMLGRLQYVSQTHTQYDPSN
jgi:patatin-like phospholipase/acyl hydrolase